MDRIPFWVGSPSRRFVGQIDIFPQKGYNDKGYMLEKKHKNWG